MWLAEAMIVNNCYNATEPTVGLAMSEEHTTRKCYMADRCSCKRGGDTSSDIYGNVFVKKIANINNSKR